MSPRYILNRRMGGTRRRSGCSGGKNNVSLYPNSKFRNLSPDPQAHHFHNLVVPAYTRRSFLDLQLIGGNLVRNWYRLHRRWLCHGGHSHEVRSALYLFNGCRINTHILLVEGILFVTVPSLGIYLQFDN